MQFPYYNIRIFLKELTVNILFYLCSYYSEYSLIYNNMLLSSLRIFLFMNNTCSVENMEYSLIFHNSERYFRNKRKTVI